MSNENGARGFNADERARRREEGPIVIGGRTYHPRRLTNKRIREIRRMARTTGREAERMARDTDEYREAYQDARDDGMEEKEAREIAKEAGLGADHVAEASMESLVQQLHALLVDDGAQPVPEDVLRGHLDDDLDTRDIEGLMSHLVGSDPTEAPTPTS